ncbi:MAG: hypothetical protein GEEBNDBF_00302 [bacterium]|nr:hypothetical protein [bacterium]
MDIRISTGLNPRPLTPRQEQQARLDRWRAGASDLAQAPQPVAPAASSAPPQSVPSNPDPFPYVQIPFGGYQEADPAQALRRSRQAAAQEDSPEIPFRRPSEMDDTAAAKEISRALSEAIESEAREADARAEAAREAAAALEAAAEARRPLQERQTAALRERVQQLGSLMELVVGRYGMPPGPASPDTSRQA